MKNRLMQMLVGIMLIAVSVAVSISASAQTLKSQQKESEDEPTLRIGTELLQIDAVVTDKQGRPIDNLKAEDFILLEDGKPQELAFFSLVKSGSPLNPIRLKANPSRPGIPVPTEIPAQIDIPGRTFVMLIDDLHISPSNLPGVKKQLINFIDEKLLDGDRVAIVNTGGGLGFLQQLTDDRRVMRLAVNRLVSQLRSSTLPGDPAQITEFQAQKILEGDLQAKDLAVNTYIRNTGDGLTREAVERVVESTARQIVLSVAALTSATLNTAKNAVSSLKNIPGRKTMLLVSDGFLLELREANHSEEMNRVIDAATRSGVVIYSLSSAGLVALSPTGRDISEASVPDQDGTSLRLSSQSLTLSTTAMSTLAKETGGFTTLNTNDIRLGFQRLAEDGLLYYVLSYYPENTARDGKFRKIEIRLKDRKDLIVRSRKGYLAPSDKKDEAAAKKEKEKKEKASKQKTSADPAVEDIQKALYSIVPDQNMHLKVKGSFFAGGEDKGNTIVSLAVHLPNVGFEKAGDQRRNTLTAVLVVLSQDGKVIEATDNKVELKFTEQDFERNSKGWFIFGKTLALKPGLYNLRFAARDPIKGVVGSASEWLEVPDLSKKQFMMSSILMLREDPSNAPAKASAVTGEDSTMGVDGSVQALRIFSERSTLGFLSYLYNSPSSKDLMLQIQILRNDSPIFTAPLRPVKGAPDKFNRIPCGARLPLSGFPPGRYVLSLTAVDPKTNKQTSQQQDFTIE